MSNTKHFPSFSVVNGHVKVQVDLTRFDKQFRKRSSGLMDRL